MAEDIKGIREGQPFWRAIYITASNPPEVPTCEIAGKIEPYSNGLGFRQADGTYAFDFEVFATQEQANRVIAERCRTAVKEYTELVCQCQIVLAKLPVVTGEPQPDETDTPTPLPTVEGVEMPF